MPGEQSFYNEDEAQEILRLAARDSTSGGMSHDELVKAAGELGIPAEAILNAEQEIKKQRAAQQLEVEEKALRREFDIYQKRRFYKELADCFSMVAICTLVWYFTRSHYFWPMWVMLGGGIGVVSAFSRIFLNPLRKERAYERWQRKRNRQAGQDTANEIRIRLGVGSGFALDAKTSTPAETEEHHTT
jgi:hypothetical protein